MLPLLVTLLLAAPPGARPCDPRAPRSAARYDSVAAPTLAGQYDLTLTTTTPRTGFGATGLLELVVADSVHRWTAAPLAGAGPRVRGLDRPLWGWAELTGDSFVDFRPLARRDPEHPAAVLVADGRLLLSWPAPGVFQLELRIERVDPRGAWGTWTEAHGLRPMVSTGGDLTPWRGYFCATRRPSPRPPGA